MALNENNQGEIGRISPERSLSKTMEQVRTWAAAAGLGLLVSMNPATANDAKTEGVQVADASGNVVLANYENGKLSPTDIQSGIKELTKGFISEGETPESAKGYAEETLTAFLSGNNDGGIEYIAKFAPSLTQKILANPGEYPLAIILDTETRKLSIAKTEQEIIALDKLVTTLSGNN